MEWFWIKQDERIAACALIKSAAAIRDYRKIHQGNVSLLPSATAISIASRADTLFADILDKQIFMVSDMVMDIFRSFLPDMDNRFICLIDRPREIYIQYNVPVLNCVDCVSKQSIHLPGSTHFEKLVVETELLGDTEIVRAKHADTCIVLASQAVVECILRKNPNGISIQKVYSEC